MITFNWLRSRGLMLSVAALGLLAACMGSAARPKPATGGTLSLSGERGLLDKPSGALKVAFTSPEGSVGLVTEVNVVFDRPVHPLEVVSDAPTPLRITPAVPGSYRWVGSRAAVFTPAGRLPFATAFTVEVPAGLQALDGTRLAETRRFALETRRPALQSSTPADGEHGLPLDTALGLQLNQAVTKAALRAAAKLEKLIPGGDVAIPFDVAEDPKQPQRFIVRPKRPLSPHSAVRLTLAASLRGSEGPLEAGSERTVTFYTYDPLALQELSCARDSATAPCEADSSVSLIFNNSIAPRSLKGKLHVTPDVGLKLFDGDASAESATTYVQLQGRFRAGQSYRLQIEPGVVDEFGQTLQAPVTTTFRFADHHPRVDIGAVGRNFGGGPLTVPVGSRNVPAFELLTAPLSAADLLSWHEAQRAGAGSDKELDWLASFKGVRVQQIKPRSPKNQIDRLLLDAAKLLAPSGRGALAIGARYTADRADYAAPPPMKVLNLSDLAITAKLSRFGSLVWVTERATNAPVSGAQVALVMPGRPELDYVTDSDGLAHVPAADFAPNLEGQGPEERAILLARRGADSVFAPVSEYLESYRLDVPTDFSGALHPYGVLFSDRGIYRPGDEVLLKGIVRAETSTGNALPPEKPVKISLRSPGGDELASESVMLTSYGTLSSKLRVPSGAELGTYYATVSGLGSERFFLQESLEVAEYRPVELRVSASTDRPQYVRGDGAKLEVKADYLFGAAATGLSATLSVSRGPTWFQVPGADDFVTSAESYYGELSETSPAGELRRETRQLDQQGRVAWAEKLDLPGQRGTELLRVDAEVTDVSRRSVASSSSALVHPAAFYVGLKLDGSWFVDAPGSVKPRILALDPSGRHLPGKRVTLALLERRYTFAKEAAGDDYRGVSKVIDREVTRCEVTSGFDPVSCPLPVPSAGYYLIVARAKDERGNSTESAAGIYATGSGEPTWQDSDRRSLTLVLDKKSYAVGERARVLIKSPYKDAEALITVERSGVYHVYHRVLHGTAPSFDIPVTNELLPNAFVGVHLLPRRSGKSAPLEPGSYRIGYANLLVNADARRLTLRATPNKADFRPGENIDVSLSVKDARGAPAANTEVTLYAADEGVLSLIDYHTPDPLLTFSGARALQVATLESRDAEGRILLESLGGRDKGRDGGGGGEAGGRRDFRQTAYFNPRIITDVRGEAKVSFKLPEALTTYRLMAVAVTRDDRYGFTQQRVTTSKPLMARPALPRFVRAGDAFQAGVIISKKGLAAGRVRVSATFGGLDAQGPLTRELDVPENGSIEAAFGALAAHPGQASVRFEVSAGSERDVVTQLFPVSLPMALETAAIGGQTAAARTEKLGNLSAARDDAGGLSVTLASSALVGIDQTALDLIEYPYSCSEQLASRILPLVALGDLAKALGFTPPADARRRAESALSELLPRQQGDGGFGMWPESSVSSEWLSPYVALVLARALHSGFVVPKPALERARDYLRALSEQSFAQSLRLPTAALALDALGELGFADAGGINRLFARRKELPLFGRALLLHAAVNAKLGSDVARELTRDLESSVHLDGERAIVAEDGGGNYIALLDSETRTQALVLRALAAQGKHPLLSALAKGLMSLRKQGKFRTTQEGAWALLALADYRRVAEPEAPSFSAKLSLGAERLAEASFEPAPPLAQHFELPLARLLRHGGEALLFEKHGSGQLFYEARLRYARRELPQKPLDAGFYIEKSLRSVSADSLAKPAAGAPPGLAREVSAGDLVLVDLVLVTPGPRKYVVLDDALPAGLEAIDPKLFTTADWLKNVGVSDSADCAGCDGPDDATPAFRPMYDRSEVRDDRVVFFADELPPGLWHYRYLARATTRGHFVLPPTRVEEMYEPEVMGRTAAVELTVR